VNCFTSNLPCDSPGITERQNTPIYSPVSGELNSKATIFHSLATIHTHTSPTATLPEARFMYLKFNSTAFFDSSEYRQKRFAGSLKLKWLGLKTPQQWPSNSMAIAPPI
jgi:hypothetical protein